MGKAFKLQSVLNHRQILERQAQQQLARAISQQGELMAQLARQRAELDFMRRDLAEKEKLGIDIADLNLYQSHLRFSEQQLRELELQLERVNSNVSHCRTELMRTSQDRQMVEKLKSRHAEQLRRDELQRENLNLDEIALRIGQGGLT